MIKFLQQGVNFLQQNELSKAKAAFEFVLNNVRKKEKGCQALKVFLVLS